MSTAENETDILELSCPQLAVPCDAASLRVADRFFNTVAESLDPEEGELSAATRLFASLVEIARMTANDDELNADASDLVATINLGLGAVHAVLNGEPAGPAGLQRVYEDARSRWEDCLALTLDAASDRVDAWASSDGLEPASSESEAPESESQVEPSADEVHDILAALGAPCPAPIAPAISPLDVTNTPTSAPVTPPQTPVSSFGKPAPSKSAIPVGPVAIEDEEFAEAFLDDACRCLASMEEALLTYERDGGTHSLDQLCRELHTLKGAAGSVGLLALGEYLHSVEDDVRASCDRSEALDTDMVLACVDAVRQQIAALQPTSAAGPEASSVSVTGTPSAAPAMDDVASTAEPTLRVKAAQIDRLMDMLAELVMLRNQRETRVEGLKSLHAELMACAGRARALDSQHRANGSAERSDRVQPAQQSSSMVEVADDLREIGRGLREQYEPVADENELVSRFIRQFRQELVDLRRVPVSGLFRRLQRSVRDAAKAEGKKVQLEFVGEDAGIDRTLQESLYEPLLHIVRNAVSHGIEEPEARAAAGKSESGVVTLEASGGANFMVIEVRDDGKGLDYDGLRRRGVELGFLRNDQPASRDELAQFIFRPGFSTRTNVTEVSGRGVGMDVVASALQRMRSWVEVDSEPGSGTRIRLTIPLRSVIEHAMVFRSQGQLYAVPMRFVQSAGGNDGTADKTNVVSFGDAVGRASTANSARLVIGYGGRDVGPNKPQGSQGSRGRRVSLLVDDIVGPEEVVMRPLPQLLKQHQLYSGVTLAGSGEIVLVFDTQQLVELSLKQALQDSASELAAPENVPSDSSAVLTRTALVVDDSLTARKSMTRMLEMRGMHVVDATDGHEALQLLQQSHFDLVVSDLEMPRLDGLTLLERLRTEPSLAALPFILSSSRDDEPFQVRARDLNALAYLKKPVSEELLDEALQRNPHLQPSARQCNV